MSEVGSRKWEVGVNEKDYVKYSSKIWAMLVSGPSFPRIVEMHGRVMWTRCQPIRTTVKPIGSGGEND